MELSLLLHNIRVQFGNRNQLNLQGEAEQDYNVGFHVDGDDIDEEFADGDEEVHPLWILLNCSEN